MISREILKTIIDRYDNGETLTAICDNLGLKQPSISKALKRQGLILKPKASSISEAQLEKAKILYAEGHSQQEVADIIGINEGQFFDDIVPWVKNLVDKHQKQVYICGLDGDFKRERFGNLLDLVPMCDKVTKLTALCGFCKDGTRAIFTYRTSASNEQVLIGEKDSYVPLCRKCYNINMQNNIN